MDFWENKCFICLVIAVLVAIAGLSTNTTIQERRNQDTIVKDTL